MKKLMYRTLCVFLALIMLCGAAPLSALAVDGGVTVITGGATVGSTLMAVGGTGGDGGGGGGGGIGEGGGGGGGIGEGGGGETPGSSFIPPVESLYAEAGRWVNGTGFIPMNDVELDHLSEASGVCFFYHAKDANGNTYGFYPTEYYLGENSSELQYVFVYSDSDPKDDPLTAYTPVGRTREAWLNEVAAFETANPGTKDYSALLATLNWQPVVDYGALPVFSNEDCYGTTPVGDETYSNRYYSVFMRWTRGDYAYYSTDSTRAYIHKRVSVIAEPLESAAAYPFITSSNVEKPKTHVVSRSATETDIDFRFSFLDGASVEWTNFTPSGNIPSSEAVTVEYLWRYSDTEAMAGLDAMAPIGMSSLEWNTMRSDYLTTHSGRGGGEVDYNELLNSLSGWTTDPALPLFDDAAVYGTEEGEGVYTSRWYSCAIRITVKETGWSRAFMNSGKDTCLHIIMGDYGVLNSPATMTTLELTYYNTENGADWWDYMWYVKTYASSTPYSEYVMRFAVKDDLGQNYGRVNTNLPDLPSNARIEFLWTYIPWDEATGGSTELVTNYEPNFNQIPIGMTREEWHALIDGKTDEERIEVLASLEGWTEDNRLPVFSVGRRYYYAYTRLIIDGMPTQYYWQGRAVGFGVVQAKAVQPLTDKVFTIGENVPESVTFDCALDVTGEGSNKGFQWYEASGRDSEGTPIEGATSRYLTIELDPETPFTKYYYCVYSYDVTHTQRVYGQTNSARLTVSSAPTGTVFVTTGRSYFGPDEGKSTFDMQYGEWRYQGGSVQTLGSVGTLSGFWQCVGRPFYMTWQWYVSDDADELGEPIGDLHTVWDPVEEGATGYEPNKKCNILLQCPSDELGDKYYRVVCVNYAKNGDFFSCTSDAVKITTIEPERRDELFEVYEDGTLWDYSGFEDVIVVPATVGGVAVTSIGGLHCAAKRIVLPEGVTEIKDDAFSNAQGLREVILPSTLRTIGESAFLKCGLERLEIPKGVESIGFFAFREAFTSASTLVMRCGNCEISKGAFYKSAIGRIDFDVTSCPTFNAGPSRTWLDVNHAFSFEECDYLYWLTMPENVTMNIPNYTFWYCPAITWVENQQSIPNVESMLPFYYPCPFKAYVGKDMFVVGNYLCCFDTVNDENYPKLEELNVEETVRVVKVLYFDGSELTIPDYVGRWRVTGVGLPSGYKEDLGYYRPCLPENGFGFTDDITAVTSLTLPVYLRHIAYSTFRYASLTSVNLNDLPNLNYVGERAFYDQRKLEMELTLPKNCIVAAWAFKDCRSLTALHLDNATLYDDCFSNCISVTEVTGTWTVGGSFDIDYYEFYKGYVRCFHLVPYFTSYTLFTHKGSMPVTESFDYRVDLDYSRGAVTDFWGHGGKEKPDYAIFLFKEYITWPYVYRGTPDNAYIFYYIDKNATELYFPSEIYNEELGVTFHIKGVFCDDDFIEAESYTVTVEDGVIALGKQAILDVTQENSGGDMYKYDQNGNKIAGWTWGNESGAGYWGECLFDAYGVSGASFPRATEINLPDSIMDIGNIFANSEAAEIQVPADVKILCPGAFSECPNLERVIFRGNKITRVDPLTFYNCPNLSAIDFGGSPSFLQGSLLFGIYYGVSSDLTITISPNTESIVSTAVQGSENGTVVFTGHSTHTPILNSNTYGAPHETTLDAFRFGDTLRCYEGSKVDGWAKEYHEGEISYLPETQYRLIEFIDAETKEYIPMYERIDDPLLGNIIDNVKSIDWYDVTNGETYVGSNKEIQGDFLDPGHTYKVRVVFADHLIQNYFVEDYAEYYLEPGESYKTVELTKRPTWTIKAILPKEWGNYVIVDPDTLETVEMGESHYDRNMTVYPGLPGLEPTYKKEYASRFIWLELTASEDIRIELRSNTYEDYVIEGLSDPDGDNFIDLGEIELTLRREPQLRYEFIGVLPDESEVEGLDRTNGSWASFDNLTTGIHLVIKDNLGSSYTHRREYLTIGDEIKATFEATQRTPLDRYSWLVDSVIFLVEDAEDENGGRIYVPVEENARITLSYTDRDGVDLTEREVDYCLHDANGLTVKTGRIALDRTAEFYLADGSYTLAFNDPSIPHYVADPQRSRYTEDSYRVISFTVSNHEDRAFSVDSGEVPHTGKLKTEANFTTNITVDLDNHTANYVPVTFTTVVWDSDYDKLHAFTEAEKLVEFRFKGYSELDPYLELNGKRAWYVNHGNPTLEDSVYYDEVTDEAVFSVLFSGYKLTFTVYVPYDNLLRGYSVTMTMGDAVCYAGTVTREGAESDGFTVSQISPLADSEAETHTVTISSPEMMTETYVQVYANGVLLEDVPGCGYTHLIHKARSRAVTFDAVSKGEGTATNYVIALCRSPEKRLSFDYGRPRQENYGDYLLVDEQQVAYCSASVLGTYAMWLDIQFVQYDREGRLASQGFGKMRATAFFDESNKLIRNADAIDYFINPSFMNPDGTYAVKTEYRFSMKLRNPSVVVDETVTLRLKMGNGDKETVLLRYNKMTETFDGILEIEPDIYTPDTLLESYSFRYETAVPETFSYRLGEDDAAIVSPFDSVYSRLSDLEGALSDFRDEYTEIDMALLRAALSVFKEQEVFGENTDLVLELIQTTANYENELHNAVEDFAAKLESFAAGNAVFSESGLADMLNDISGTAASAQVVSYTGEELIAGGYIPQETSEGTVFLRIVGGVMRVYYPDDCLEVELDMSASEPLIEDTTSAKKGLKALKSGAKGGQKGGGLWDEITSPETACELARMAGEFLCQWAGLIKSLGDMVLSFIGTMKTIEQETITTIEAGYKLVENLGVKEPLAAAKQAYAAVKQDIFIKVNQIADLSDYIDDLQVDAALEKAFGKAEDLAQKVMDVTEGMGLKSKMEAELAALETAEKELYAKVEDLSKIQYNLEYVKNSNEIKLPLAKGASLKNAIITKVGAFTGNPIVGIVSTAIDAVFGTINVYNEYCELCQCWNDNLEDVRILWEIRSADGATEECRTAADALHNLLFMARMRYLYKFCAVFQNAVSSVTIDIMGIVSKIGAKQSLAIAICSFTLGALTDLCATVGKAQIMDLIPKAWESVTKICGDKDDDDDDYHDVNHKKHIDPAGFVYEAVASNRVEGATVTAYYKGAGDTPILWNAVEDEQQNPLVTGEDGAYEWLTPMGDWLVTAEKQGYYMATSSNDPEAVDGWLPVPPPQMNVNIGMRSMSAPSVSDVQFSGKEIRVLFSQYMDIAALESNSSFITVTKNGSPVPVEFRFADREVSPKDDGVWYGRILYVTPAEGYDFYGEISLTVSGEFANYAGTAMGNSYESETLTLTQIPGSLSHSYPNRLVTDVGDQTGIAVRLLDTNGDPIANKEVLASALFDLYELPASAVTDENGRAVFEALSLRSGTDVLTFTCEDASAELNTYVNPLGTAKPAKPTANLSDYDVVEIGTQLILSCATEGAIIRYTLDDTCPCDNNAQVYTGPITLSADTFIRIAAWTEAGGYSERLNLHISVNTYGLPAWDLSHDGVVDTADVSILLTDILFQEAEAAWDVNNDGDPEPLDALALMTDGFFTDPEDVPAVFITAAYDGSGRMIRLSTFDLSDAISDADLEYLKTAPSIRFFYLDSDCAPMADAFAYLPGN